MKEILERISVREYTDQPLDKETIDAILKAGFAAPSARDARPWEFLVVQDKETLQKMSKVSPNAYMLEHAAMGMVILADTRDIDLGYACQDCAAATENMLVAAHKLGVGSCWIGCWPREERVENLRDIFPVPDYIQPFWMIAFGYPKSTRAVKDKWDEKKIHYEKY